MRFAWLALALGFALSCPLGGCLSGQTGSPECVGPVSCLCDPLYSAGTLLRVHVERVEAGKLEAVVDEVFPSHYGDNGVVAGDRVAGSVTAEQPCAQDAAPNAQVGGELFVLFSPGYPPEGGATLLDGVFSWAIPWAETLSFGGSFELASVEVAVLSSPESCRERFPPAPAPPCNDTQTGMACSAAPASSAGGGGYGALLLGLTALLLGARRRPKP
jgi:hypothetical protein